MKKVGLGVGLGFAVMEELGQEDGLVTTANMGEFKIPTVEDIPELVTVLLPSDEGPSPFQSKAIGESGNVATAGAIGNAVFAAAGVRITDLPITSERILRALQERGRT